MSDHAPSSLLPVLQFTPKDFYEGSTNTFTPDNLPCTREATEALNELEIRVTDSTEELVFSRVKVCFGRSSHHCQWYGSALEAGDITVSTDTIHVQLRRIYS